MKKLELLLVTLIVGTLLIGCGGAQDSFRSSATEEVFYEAEALPQEEAPAAGAPSADVATTDFVDRMIVYTGELSLVVRDANVAQDAVVSIAEDAGGYVSNASSTVYREGLRRINLSIRVPAEAFNETMASLRDLALEVTRDAVSSEDVTQEYVDLEGRLTALEAKAERLEELMDDAEDTEAVLAVYEELSETQIRIEETKGRMRYLERRSSMATITVYLEPDELSQPVEVAGWRPQGTVRRALEAVIGTFQFLVDALIWFVIAILPVLLVIGLVIWLLIRLLRAIFGRRRRGSREAEDATSDSIDSTPAT